MRSPIAGCGPASVLLLLAVAAGAVTPPPGPASPPAAGDPASRPSDGWHSKLRIIDMTGYTPLVRLHRRYGVETGLILGSWAFDTDGNGLLDDREAFIRRLRKHVPATFAGIVALDWEGTMTTWLKQPPPSPEFQLAIHRLRELLLIAKRVRPHARFGYYGLPLPNYWSRDDAWRARSLAMAPLLKDADWIGPSMYMFYETNERTQERQRRYAVESAEMALEVAAAVGGKPVYAWITHRYHPSSKLAFRPVDEDDLRVHIASILSAERDGRHVAGIVWWGADNWFLSKGRLPEGSRRRGELERVHRRYVELIAKAVRGPG